MISTIEFVLIAISTVYNPVADRIDLKYEPLDHFHSITSCNADRIKYQRKNPNKVYVCLKVDRD